MRSYFSNEIISLIFDIEHGKWAANQQILNWRTTPQSISTISVVILRKLKPFFSFQSLIDMTHDAIISVELQNKKFYFQMIFSLINFQFSSSSYIGESSIDFDLKFPLISFMKIFFALWSFCNVFEQYLIAFNDCDEHKKNSTIHHHKKQWKEQFFNLKSFSPFCRAVLLLRISCNKMQSWFALRPGETIKWRILWNSFNSDVPFLCAFDPWSMKTVFLISSCSSFRNSRNSCIHMKIYVQWQNNQKCDILIKNVESDT